MCRPLVWHRLERARGRLCLLLLGLLCACSGSATQPITVIQRWADAAQAGDYATAKTYMASSEMEYIGWQETHADLRKRQEIQTYTIGPLRANGASTTAELTWAGTSPMGSVCIMVQVGPDRKLSVLENYHWCHPPGFGG